MSQRITQDDIDQALTVLNNQLANAGRPYHVQCNARYGYQGIDLSPNDRPSVTHRTIKTGLTKRQAYDYLLAMLEGIELANGR